jgi:hypothetical protein
MIPTVTNLYQYKRVSLIRWRRCAHKRLQTLAVYYSDAAVQDLEALVYQHVVSRVSCRWSSGTCIIIVCHYVLERRHFGSALWIETALFVAAMSAARCSTGMILNPGISFLWKNYNRRLVNKSK